MTRPFGVGGSPDGWQPTQLRSFLIRRRATGFPQLPLLSVNLPLGVVLRRDDDSRPAPSDDLSAYQLVRRGDLVMNQLGKPHGALGVSDLDGIISPAYFVAGIGPSAHPRFVHFLLRTRLYISEYERRGKYMPPSQFDISWDQFRSIDVTMPPLREQRAIADFLDAETARIDGLIAKKTRLIQLLEERSRAYRSETVLRGFDPVSELGGSSMWPTAALGVLLRLHRGFDLPADSRSEGAIPVISSGGISGFHDEKGCDGPGVVTGRYGTIGEVYYIDGPYWPLNTTLFVSDFRGNDPKWAYHLLAALPLDIDAAKSAVTGINRNVVGALRVPRPSPEEQRHLAASVDADHARVDGVTSLLERQIDLLVEHRQALITAAVTGELDIPGVAA